MSIQNRARLMPPYGAILPEAGPVRLADKWNDIVVSYDENGDIVSKAADIVWDLTPYDAHKVKLNLNFVYWRRLKHREIEKLEISPERWIRIQNLQYLMCSILFSSDAPELGVKKFAQYQYSLKRMANFAEKIDKSVFDILADPILLENFLNVESLNSFCNLMRVLRYFYNRKQSETHFEVATLTSWNVLCKKEQQYYASIKQHAPLPTRIYSDLIRNLDEELEFLDNHLPAALIDLETVVADWRLGKYRSKGNLKDNVPNLRKIIERYGKTSTLTGIGSAIKDIYIICKLQIHVFTGMRSKEVNFLPFDCMESNSHNGRSYALIVGETTKLNKGQRLRARWVTTLESGHRAVKLMQSIAGFIYKCIGVLPSREDVDKDKFRLFVSTDYLPWANRFGLDKTGNKPFARMNGMLMSDKGNEKLVAKLLSTIDANDLRELEDIDPFRVWHEESEFQVGKQWPLKSHQLRRSLALYARSSGVVRISSLRRQLQHISNDMSAYYSNGSAFARSFLEQDPSGFNNHVVKEWQDTAGEAEVLSFMRDVINSEEPLHGGSGHFYYSQIRIGNVLSRDEVKKAIKAGTLAYTSSPIGGCTKPGRCEVNTGLSLVNVVCATQGCKFLVGKHSKITQVITIKERILKHLPPESIEYKAESEELNALRLVEEQWRPTSTDRQNKGGEVR